MNSKYISIESTNGMWLGYIYLKVQNENKIQYITKDYPNLGITADNYKDRSNHIVRWNKKTLYHRSCRVVDIPKKIPLSNVSKIYD